MTHVESWKDDRIRGHAFRGVISNKDLSMDPDEVVERVKHELVASIVERIMNELGPRLDEAMLRAWEVK